MTLESMLQRLRDRTHLLNKDSSLIAELNSAQVWAWNRIVTLNDNVLKVDDFEATMAGTTSTYNLGAAVSTGTLVAVKWLGVKFSGDTKFVPVIWVDSSDNRFISADQDTAATNGPVYCTSENVTQVRFAPPLPSGAIVRCDYIYSPADLNLETNCSPDLPDMVQEASVDKATAQVLINLDDTRAGYWEQQALAKLYSAMNSLNKRQYQQPGRTRPFTRVRGWART